MLYSVDWYDAEDIVTGLGEWRTSPGATLTERIYDGLSGAWDNGHDVGYLLGLQAAAQALGLDDLAGTEDPEVILEQIVAHNDTEVDNT